MGFRQKFGEIPVPGWLFLAVMVVYHEWLLHLWVMDSLHWGRLAVVTAFGLGFGGVSAC